MDNRREIKSNFKLLIPISQHKAPIVAKLKFSTNHAGYTRRDKNRARIHKTDIKYMKEQSPTEKLCFKSSWWSKTSTNNKPIRSNGADSEDAGAQDLKTEQKPDNLMFGIYGNYKKIPQVDQKRRLSIHHSSGWHSSRDISMQAQRSSSNPFATSALETGGWSASRSGIFTPRKDPVPIVQEDEWASGTVG